MQGAQGCDFFAARGRDAWLFCKLSVNYVLSAKVYYVSTMVELRSNNNKSLRDVGPRISPEKIRDVFVTMFFGVCRASFSRPRTIFSARGMNFGMSEEVAPWGFDWQNLTARLAGGAAL